jgi:CDP-glycerol glycerophosphotransferase
VAKLSVVVPIYNVAAYLRDALTSIAQQTLRDLEVIMVDDGSTDESAAVAASFAARDSRFRLLRQENRGQGQARNLGVRHAAGHYLAFADADDLVPRYAYTLLVDSLEATGSDLAAGGVRRFSSGLIYPTVVHTAAYRTTMRRTDAARHPALLQDCTVWNKVYRRSFWDSAELEFWSERYEDIPVCIRAYVVAKSIDIRREIVYYWRGRESGQLSRIQKERELANVEARMRACSEASRIITRLAPALKPAFDRRVLGNDLVILVRALEYVSEPARRRLLELGSEYLRTVDDSLLRTPDVLTRLRYWLIRAGMHDELLTVMRYSLCREADDVPLVRLGRPHTAWYLGYPYLADPSRAIPLHVYDADPELTPEVAIETVRWHAGKLRIEGYAYIRRIDCSRRDDVRIDVLLRNRALRRALRLRVERISRPDVTALAGPASVCYDWSGFAVDIDPARLSTLGAWKAASWELRVRIAANGIRREGPVTSITPGTALWPESRWVADGVRVQPSPEQDNRFLIRAQRPAALATTCRADGLHLQVEGWSAVPLGPGAAIVVSLQQGGGLAVRVPAAATTSAAGRFCFLADLAVSGLLQDSGAEDRGHDAPDGTGARVPTVTDEIHWDFALDAGDGRRIRLAGEPDVIGRRLALGEEELTTYLTPFGNLSAVQRRCCPAVRHVSWTPEDRLVLRGDFPGGAERPEGILLRSIGTGYQHTVPLRWKDNDFTASLSPGRMPGPGADVPLASGQWDMLAFTSAGVTRVVADRRLLTLLPAPRPVGIHDIAVEFDRNDALQIRVQRSLAAAGTPAQRTPPDRSRSHHDGGALALFESHGGRQYSGDPRAIYENLRGRGPVVDCVWVTRDGQFSLPADGAVVVRGSREHHELAARARCVVGNTLQPTWYSRPPGQVYLQTGLGTPLKRLALDIESPQFERGMIHHERVREDVASWSALLSANTFSTATFRKAFGFDGEILEFGSPRNDLLRHPDRDARAARVRRRLGLPASQRVVLYAPTWRDDALISAAGLGFPQHLDFHALARALGPDHVTLVRAHPRMQEAIVAGDAGSGIRDVTQYPDLAELLLIADVLITDYSSAMFDFAVTGRPMLFFTYDLDRYRDRIRGFSFDFEAEAPGPLLRTSGEVVDAMRDLAATGSSYRGAYEAFAAKFCSAEDGHAAARAADWLLAKTGQAAGS